MIGLVDEKKKTFDEMIKSIKKIDQEMEISKSNHSENTLLLFFFDNSEAIAQQFKAEFDKKYPSRKLMMITSINLDIYSFRAPCTKCSSLLLGKNQGFL